jgi:hypothetical protein
MPLEEHVVEAALRFILAASAHSIHESGGR